MAIEFYNIHVVAFTGIMICWMGFALIFLFRKKPPRSQKQKQERFSFIGIALQGVSYAIIWSFRRPFFTPLFPISPLVENAIAVVAVILAIGSVWMVISATKALGKQWSLGARVVRDHELVTDGPYRIVRNPIYTGMFGMMLATGLAISLWIALPPAITFFFAGTNIRVRSEERLLREVFGARFDEYVHRVPSFIPGIHI